jgi:hypothetical protein
MCTVTGPQLTWLLVSSICTLKGALPVTSPRHSPVLPATLPTGCNLPPPVHRYRDDERLPVTWLKELLGEGYRRLSAQEHMCSAETQRKV